MGDHLMYAVPNSPVRNSDRYAAIAVTAVVEGAQRAAFEQYWAALEELGDWSRWVRRS